MVLLISAVRREHGESLFRFRERESKNTTSFRNETQKSFGCFIKYFIYLKICLNRTLDTSARPPFGDNVICWNVVLFFLIFLLVFFAGVSYNTQNFSETVS